MKLLTWLRLKLFKLYLKIVCEKASPEYIARGWAIGMFYGCLIPFGLQLALSIPTAFFMKASKIGATLGTLFTNHFTIFIIYPVQCYVGSRLLGHSFSYDDVDAAMQSLVQEQSIQALLEIGNDLIAAFFMGGLLLTAVMTPLTYVAVKAMVIRHRRHVQRIKDIKRVIKKK